MISDLLSIKNRVSDTVSCGRATMFESSYEVIELRGISLVTKKNISTAIEKLKLVQYFNVAWFFNGQPTLCICDGVYTGVISYAHNFW